jgi:endonuclease-8
MPEGDTIFRAARALEKALGGKVVTAFETGLAKLASVNDDTPLVGRTIERVEARGKWCLIFFSGDLILVTHMLMSGTWHIYKTGEKWWQPKNRMRVAITCGDYQAVAFNVPIAEFHTARSLERNAQVPRLGPDVLGVKFSIAAGVRALGERAASHPADEIAVVLLNQRVLAGLGNVYKSEVAFAAGVNPFRPMSTLRSRTFPQPLEPATYTFYKEYEVPKVPLCRGYRTPIVHGGLFERPRLMSKPGPNCKAKGEVVEAGRIELPSEETNDREHSCFSHVHLCLVSVA